LSGKPRGFGAGQSPAERRGKEKIKEIKNGKGALIG